MLPVLKQIVSEFKQSARSTMVKIVSDYDTDGITAASIMTRALKREDIRFAVNVVKHLEKETLDALKQTATKNDIFIFLDIGSAVIEALSEFPSHIIILDHHELSPEFDTASLQKFSNIRFFNPRMYHEEVSAAGLSYLFAKFLNEGNKDLSSIAIIGMVGDMIDQDFSRINDGILKDAQEEGEVVIKKGPLIFSATRPLNKALEFSSNFFIPGVTGNSDGALNLLREAGIKYANGRHPSLMDLSADEMSKLVTGIMLRRVNQTDHHDEILGNIYLVKSYGKLEDAREMSVMINACSRLGQADVAMQFCLEHSGAKLKVQDIYDQYKHEIINGMKFFDKSEKITGKRHVLINAKDKILDSIIGTITSIVASSFLYPEGTVVVGMAHHNDKIKVSARIAGKSRATPSSLDLGKLMNSIVTITGGEAGGHEKAAGCFIPRESEQQFIDALAQHLNVEEIKIAV